MTWAALQERTNRAVLRAFGSTQSNSAKLGWKPVSGDLVEAGGLVSMDGIAAQATQPVFVIATPDLPDAPVGELLQIGARSWLVEEARPDDGGMTLLYLKAAR